MKDGDYIRFKLRPKHDRLLGILAMLTLATSEQLNRALYAPGSLTTTEHLLYSLYKERYLDRVFWRTHDRGNPRNVWKVGGRGMRYLHRKNLAPKALIRSSDNTTHTRSQLTHTMGAANCLVHALELQKMDPKLELFYASEPTLRRHPLVVGSGLSQVTIYPDAYVRFTKTHRTGAIGEAAVAFELTRTTDAERIKQKLWNWIQADGSSEYRELFGTDLLIVAWVIDEMDIARRDTLARTCWRLLQELHAQEKADLFVFGWMDDITSGRDFFFDPMRWVQPGEEPSLRSLLPMTWNISRRSSE